MPPLQPPAISRDMYRAWANTSGQAGQKIQWRASRPCLRHARRKHQDPRCIEMPMEDTTPWNHGFYAAAVFFRWDTTDLRSQVFGWSMFQSLRLGQ